MKPVVPGTPYLTPGRGSGDTIPTAVYRRVAHGKMALSEAAIPCLRWRFRLVKAGGYKPEAPAKAISEALRRPDNPSANRLQTALTPKN